MLEKQVATFGSLVVLPLITRNGILYNKNTARRHLQATSSGDIWDRQL
jgi:hypothetical protein